jgi:hypothetical protein
MFRPIRPQPPATEAYDPTNTSARNSHYEDQMRLYLVELAEYATDLLESISRPREPARITMFKDHEQ